MFWDKEGGCSEWLLCSYGLHVQWLDNPYNGKLQLMDVSISAQLQIYVQILRLLF